MNIPADHPAPEIACRDALAVEIPTSAARLAEHARLGGWTVRITYARGTKPTRTAPVVDSIAVRCTRAGSPILVGVWIDGLFEVGLSSYGRTLLLAQLKAALAVPAYVYIELGRNDDYTPLVKDITDAIDIIKAAFPDAEVLVS